jgi:hypothetical protein
MHKSRNMLLVVLVLSAALVSTPRSSYAIGSLPSDPSVRVVKPGVDPATGEPDVGQTLPHATSYKSGPVQSPIGHEWTDSGKTGWWLSIGRIWAALYLKTGI